MGKYIHDGWCSLELGDGPCDCYAGLLEQKDRSIVVWKAAAGDWRSRCNEARRWVRRLWAKNEELVYDAEKAVMDAVELKTERDALMRERVAYLAALCGEDTEIIERVTKKTLGRRNEITNDLADGLSAIEAHCKIEEKP
jgi:hypothetical protein